MAGLSMVSGAAFAQTSGSVGANLTKIDTDFGDADAYGVDGEVIIPMGGEWSAIIEARTSTPTAVVMPCRRPAT